MHAARLEVDLDAIAANWRTLRDRHGADVAAVVKADAYGLGAAAVGRRLLAEGARHFFVAHLSEALALRPAVPGAMVAVLNGLQPGTAAEYVAHDLTPVLGALAEVDDWAAAARAAGRALPALLHLDTGMHRLGLPPSELAVIADNRTRLAGIAVRAVMTHLVSAECPNEPINTLQLQRFAAACARLPPWPRSIANSSGIFLGDAARSDLARPGAALYGVNPTPWTANPMRAVVRLLAPVLQVRDVPAGETVGYNGIFTAARDSRIATVSVGYADGWLRSASGRGVAHFDGKAVPLVGRVSMDLTTYDVTDAPGVRPGSLLELIGPHRTIDDAAHAAGTNGYEMLTSLGRRYDRRILGA
jgi:alanine racemase